MYLTRQLAVLPFIKYRYLGTLLTTYSGAQLADFVPL